VRRPTALIALTLIAASATAATIRADAVPPGATAKCRDGTYSYSQHRSGTCSHHGGVAEWLNGSSTSGGFSSSGGATHTAACGVERWTVKTLQDRPVLLAPRVTTVHYLVTRPAPATLPYSRLPFERHVYTIVAAVTLVRPEADSDFTSCSSLGRIT
jgi:hypothetical protein